GLVMLIAACSSSAVTPPASAPSALTGKPLPSFARETLAGDRVDTKALRGKVVVVKFFAKYCEPCKRTLPAAEKLHEARPEVAFIGVDEDASQDDAAAMVARYHLTFPVVVDRDNVLSGRFRVSELPHTFVADA